MAASCFLVLPVDFFMFLEDEIKFLGPNFLGFRTRKALYLLFPCQLCKKHYCKLGDYRTIP